MRTGSDAAGNGRAGPNVLSMSSIWAPSKQTNASWRPARRSPSREFPGRTNERHSDGKHGGASARRRLEAIAQRERTRDADGAARLRRISEVDMACSGRVERLQNSLGRCFVADLLNYSGGRSQRRAENAGVARRRPTGDRPVVGDVGRRAGMRHVRGRVHGGGAGELRLGRPDRRQGELALGWRRQGSPAAAVGAQIL
jgi:hypothetical protein